MNDARGKPLPSPRDVVEARIRLWWAIGRKDSRLITQAMDDLVEVARGERAA